MPNRKQFIIASVTLGLIGAASAGLIGLTNLITKDRIVQNEKNKINAGIREIFGENTSVSNEFDTSGLTFTKDYKYSEYFYEVNNESTVVGYAIRTTGSNLYGKISLLVGIDKTTFNFKSLSIITNEQTYASTLVDKYIDPLNGGSRDLNDTSCGATYGANLVKDMVLEASEIAKEIWNK